MVKAKPIRNQLAFAFEPPAPATHAAALAGIDARTARMIGEALNSDSRPREIIAAEMSILLDEEVSKAMLDAYSAPGKPDHNISWPRMLALIAVTKRYDLLDREMRQIGAAVLVGEEIHTARVGHLKSKIADLQSELREAEKKARPISRGQRGC